MSEQQRAAAASDGVAKNPKPKRFDRGEVGYPTYEIVDEQVRLLGSRCPECVNVAFPGRDICLVCGARPVTFTLSGCGTVHAWTSVANPPAGFDEGYLYGCVDLEEGPRILAKLHGPVSVGGRVIAIPGTLRDGDEGFRFGVSDA